jgi:hypothetical protein
VLKPDGRIAGYVIHTPGGLTAGERRRAAELGPSEVVGPVSPGELTRVADLSIVAIEDVTRTFLATCEAILRAREQHAAALRAAEGDEAYEEEQVKKESMREGIRVGLLRRSLIIGRKERSRT